MTWHELCCLCSTLTWKQSHCQRENTFHLHDVNIHRIWDTVLRYIKWSYMVFCSYKLGCVNDFPRYHACIGCGSIITCAVLRLRSRRSWSRSICMCRCRLSPGHDLRIKAYAKQNNAAYAYKLMALYVWFYFAEWSHCWQVGPKDSCQDWLKGRFAKACPPAFLEMWI